MRHAALLLGLALAASSSAASDIIWAGAFDGASEPTSKRRGYLLIDSDVALDSAWLRFEIETLAPIKLPKGRQLYLIERRPGKYDIDRVDLPHFNLPYQVNMHGRLKGLRVRRGSITYGGTVLVGDARGANSVSVRLVNRSAEVYELLRTHYPNLLEQTPLTVDFDFPDDFLETVLRQGSSDDS